MRPLCSSVIALLALGASSSRAVEAQSSGIENATVLQEAIQAIERARMDLIAVRRDLHSFPERSGSESRTAAVVATRLRARGLDVRTGVGGHGVVGILRGSEPGPVIAFRADMDAVPSTAHDPVDFRSQIPGLRHICGHDIHTTVGLALADGLSAVAAKLPGTVVFIFQPAEETATGAQMMLADEVFGTLRPREIFAFHTSPIEVGRIGTQSGPALAARDRVTLAFAASSSRSDLAAEAGSLLIALGNPNLAASAPDPFVFLASPQTEGFHTGAEWRVSANLTVSGPEARAAARTQLEASLNSLRLRGVSPRIEWERRVPGAFNDRALEAALRPVIQAASSPQTLAISTTLPTPFSEDFGWFTDEIPGVMYWLGVANSERGFHGMPHNADYVADEESIQVGARAMAAVILERLRTGGTAAAKRR